MPHPEYERGYEAAYFEIERAIESPQHPQICGGKCRACQVMRSFIEDLLLNLSGVMSEEEFEALVNILANVNRRLDD